jgi:hypothetical protein
MGKLKRVSLSILLIASLSAVTVGATYVVDAATGTEQEAEAWTPSWECMMGLGIFSIGVVSSIYFPPQGVDWNFIWNSNLEAIGALVTLTSCIKELRDHYSANAGCTYGNVLQNDWTWVYPGFWYNGSRWYDRPCRPSMT